MRAQPVTLTTNTVQGKPRPGVGHSTSAPYRARAPSEPPACDRRQHPALRRGRRAGLRQLPRFPLADPYPRACSRSSSMPKWWAISWTTVISVSATTSSCVSHIRSVGPR
ncbi:hypothetical protein SBADM41S_08741 [Streptomyces badius]